MPTTMAPLLKSNYSESECKKLEGSCGASWLNQFIHFLRLPVEALLLSASDDKVSIECPLSDVHARHQKLQSKVRDVVFRSVVFGEFRDFLLKLGKDVRDVIIFIV